MKLLVPMQGHTLITDEQVDLTGSHAVLEQLNDVTDTRKRAAELFRQGFGFYEHKNVLDLESVELGQRMEKVEDLRDDGQYMLMRPMQGG